MTRPWKKGPPPEGEAGTWLVWCDEDAERVACRVSSAGPLRIHDAHDTAASTAQEECARMVKGITHHLPEKITPPGEEERET